MKLLFPFLFIGLILTGISQSGCKSGGIDDAGVYYDTIRHYVDDCYSEFRYLDQSISYTPSAQYNKNVSVSIDSIKTSIGDLEKIEPFDDDDSYRQAAISFCKEMTTVLKDQYMQLAPVIEAGDTVKLNTIADKIDADVNAAQEKFINVEKDWAKKNNINVSYYNF
jgi:hypothetical protein